MTDLERAVAALEAGAPVVVATDTVYGLAARAADAEAVAAIFALKHRPVDRRMAVLVSDAAQAARYVAAEGALYRRLTERFWPGPLTVVAPRIDGGVLAAGDDTTLGVRCPDEDFVRSLAAAVGPIAATSANLHGRPTPTTAAEVAEAFASVAVVIDGGPRDGQASTVVSVVGDMAVTLREGPIGDADIAVALGADS